jgi:hypothetical protein
MPRRPPVSPVFPGAYPARGNRSHHINGVFNGENAGVASMAATSADLLNSAANIAWRQLCLNE